MDTAFPNLLSPLRIGPVTVRNRIMSTGHDTLIQNPEGTISQAYIAYQVARVKGGAGLVVLSAAAIDDLSCSSPEQLRVFGDDVLPGLTAMADAVHAHGGVVFTQLLQAGREIFMTSDGTLPVAYSASATTGERYRVLPREMSQDMIRQIVKDYAAGAAMAMKAGMDGVEIVGNHGNLPAQFLAAAVNRRTDEYGGSLENRCRFVVEVCRAIRDAIGNRIAFGLRLSVDEIDEGVTPEESMALCRMLDAEGLVDYVSLVVGNQATRGGSTHVIAPMSEKTGYVGAHVQPVKQSLTIPVLATGRFNTAHAAEEAIATGQADMIGMTRALICDPEIGRKLNEGRPDDIRACIGCLQACIGHYNKHVPISCIQFPESGRELEYGTYPPIAQPRRILVAGGGPAGMKAAAVAAARGHKVTLCEASSQLGGQALLAQQMPTRLEFGGLVTNLQREMELAGVEVRCNTRVDRAMIAREQPDAIVIATGARTATATRETLEGAHVVTADDVIAGRVAVGKRVVIADNQRDWVGIGVAEMLAAQGHHVRLAVSGLIPGEFIPPSVRDTGMARLFRAGVEVILYARLFGADGDTAYFQHITAREPMILEGVDTVVLAFGQTADRSLEFELADCGIETHQIGDCLTPRTAEEAVYEGLKIGVLL